jgi:hypothetical protein
MYRRTLTPPIAVIIHRDSQISMGLTNAYPNPPESSGWSSGNEQCFYYFFSHRASSSNRLFKNGAFQLSLGGDDPTLPRFRIGYCCPMHPSDQEAEHNGIWNSAAATCQVSGLLADECEGFPGRPAPPPTCGDPVLVFSDEFWRRRGRPGPRSELRIGGVTIVATIARVQCFGLQGYEINVRRRR